MANRKVYHVTYSTDDDMWRVAFEDAERASSRHDTKQAAVDAGRKLAQNQMPSQLIVHNQDGTFQREYTYGDDPRTSRG